MDGAEEEFSGASREVVEFDYMFHWGQGSRVWGLWQGVVVNFYKVVADEGCCAVATRFYGCA